MNTAIRIALAVAAMVAVGLSLLVHRVVVGAGLAAAYVPPSWFRGVRTS